MQSPAIALSFNFSSFLLYNKFPEAQRHMPMGEKSAFAFLRRWYARLERPISSLSLIGGFAFDAFTLRRVDFFWDNLFVATHLVIVTVCAVWINLLDDSPRENGVQPEADADRLNFWLVNLMQFFFGASFRFFLSFTSAVGPLAQAGRSF